jgi:hypothetical protein
MSHGLLCGLEVTGGGILLDAKSDGGSVGQPSNAHMCGDITAGEHDKMGYTQRSGHMDVVFNLIASLRLQMMLEWLLKADGKKDNFSQFKFDSKA